MEWGNFLTLKTSTELGVEHRINCYGSRRINHYTAAAETVRFRARKARNTEI